MPTYKLIPSLTEDISLICFAHFSFEDYASLKLVCKSWYNLLSDRRVYDLRIELGLTEEYLCFYDSTNRIISFFNLIIKQPSNHVLNLDAWGTRKIIQKFPIAVVHGVGIYVLFAQNSVYKFDPWRLKFNCIPMKLTNGSFVNMAGSSEYIIVVTKLSINNKCSYHLSRDKGTTWNELPPFFNFGEPKHIFFFNEKIYFNLDEKEDEADSTFSDRVSKHLKFYDLSSNSWGVDESMKTSHMNTAIVNDHLFSLNTVDGVLYISHYIVASQSWETVSLPRFEGILCFACAAGKDKLCVFLSCVNFFKRILILKLRSCNEILLDFEIPFKNELQDAAEALIPENRSLQFALYFV